MTFLYAYTCSCAFLFRPNNFKNLPYLSEYFISITLEKRKKKTCVNQKHLDLVLTLMRHHLDYFNSGFAELCTKSMK